MLALKGWRLYIFLQTLNSSQKISLLPQVQFGHSKVLPYLGFCLSLIVLCLFYCLSLYAALALFGTLSPPVMKPKRIVPQVFKQVVNMSCFNTSTAYCTKEEAIFVKLLKGLSKSQIQLGRSGSNLINNSLQAIAL